MDLTPIFNQAWEVFGVLIPVAILLALIKTPWFKGVAGELIVNLSAKFMLDKKVYNLIKNVTLPTEDGTTQIDHIIISRYGVFVVETKNMKGWIFGSPHQKTWTQKIYKHSSKFQNSLHQNYKHVKTLQSLLELNPEQIHSVIVFVGDSTFKTQMPENVTYGFGYAKFIKSKTNPVLSEGEVENIVALYQDESHDPYIQSDKAIDGEWVWHDHECPDYEMPIVLDNDDVSTINEYIEAVICLIDDQLDTPFPDEHKAWLVWNPNFEIAGGLLRIIPNWEIAFDYYGEQKIIKKRLDKRL